MLNILHSVNPFATSFRSRKSSKKLSPNWDTAASFRSAAFSFRFAPAAVIVSAAPASHTAPFVAPLRRSACAPTALGPRHNRRTSLAVFPVRTAGAAPQPARPPCCSCRQSPRSSGTRPADSYMLAWWAGTATPRINNIQDVLRKPKTTGNRRPMRGPQIDLA